MKRVILPVAALLALSFAVNPAYADRDDRKDRRQQIRDYYECLFTPPLHYQGTIVDAALEFGLTTLADAVVAAGLDGVLSGPGDFTVFAPTNDAFAAIPADTLGTIVGDTAVLTAVLTYHVLGTSSYKTDPRTVFNRIRDVETLQGQKLFFNRDREGTQVNQSDLVSCQPVRTTNGTVFVIDSVLLPQF